VIVEGFDGSWAVHGDSGRVEAWSVTRLPYEPRGALLAYRAALRTALRALEPSHEPGVGFVATYGSPDDAFVDVENVCLYNVGTGAYSHLVTGGLACQRANSSDGRHHLTYEIAELPSPARGGQVLATMTASLRRVSHSPGQWWAVLRPEIQQEAHGHTGSFTADVVLRGRWTAPAIAGAVKPMLDGVICALHAHDGTHDSLRERLAELGEPDLVWAALCDVDRAVLAPPRRLLHPHGNAVAWNPADDMLTAFRVVSEATNTPALSITATVFG
jgi:hypothetical protein